MTTTRRWRLVTALVLASAACAGPLEPLEVGVKDYPSDVVLGSQTDDAPSFVPPDAMPSPARVALSLPPYAETPTTAPDPGPCPSASPLDAPRFETTNAVALPPAPATYVYRNDGTFEVSGPNAQKGALPPESTREVRDVERVDDGTFTYVVESTLGDTVTATTYRTVPLTEGRTAGGIFVASMTTKTADGPEESFDPEPDLELLRFPIEVGAEWQSAGVDPATGVLMAYNATVGVKRRVDACGTVLDAHVVTLDGNVGSCVNEQAPAPPAGVPAERPPAVEQCLPAQTGVSISRGGTSSFVATYLIGTQYGGLTLQEEIVIDATEGGVGIHRENVATISREPERPE